MKKIFLEPEVDVVNFGKEDIITTSTPLVEPDDTGVIKP